MAFGANDGKTVAATPQRSPGARLRGPEAAQTAERYRFSLSAAAPQKRSQGDADFLAIASRWFVKDGSDGTRTRGLRRDRPAL